MKISRRISVLVLCVLLASSWNRVQALEPLVVRPEDSVVNGSSIVPYTSAWRYSTITASGEKKLLGQWTDELSIVEVEGEEQILRRQTFPSKAGRRTLINRARRADLFPRSYEVTTIDGQVLQRVDFEPKRLVLTATGQGDPQIVQLEAPDPRRHPHWTRDAGHGQKARRHFGRRSSRRRRSSASLRWPRPESRCRSSPRSP